jgi:uncharacterized membrane protein YhaH (DUF805 family)
MSFTQAISSGFSNYVGFSGRASRSEYWFFMLFIYLSLFVVAFVGGLINGLTGMQSNGAAIIPGLYALALILPHLTVTVRRLHDTDRTGWWILISLVPLIGVILLLVWFCTKGTDGPNSYGPDPLAGMRYAAA